MSLAYADDTNTGIPGEHLPEHSHGPRSYAWWGMWGLIATEATLFAILIASYYYLRFRNGIEWPPGEIPKPKMELALIMSAILWTSSIPVHMAQKGIERGSQWALRGGLLVGFVLGAVFLGIQLVVEYPEKLHEFTPRTNAYGSLFYTLTGLHGSHVAVGLAMSMWVQIRAWRGAFTEHAHVTVQNFVMYWHFVDVVWLFVMSTIYLTPNL